MSWSGAWPRPKQPAIPARLGMRPIPAHTESMDAVPDRTPPGWLAELLERSEEQIAAGQTVPLEPVLNRLRASIDRIKGKRQTPALRTAHKA